MILRPITMLVLIALVMSPDLRAHEKSSEAEKLFESKIRPLLVERCHKCHTGDKPKGGLRLDSRGTAEGRRDRAGHRRGEAGREPADESRAASRRTGDAPRWKAERSSNRHAGGVDQVGSGLAGYDNHRKNRSRSAAQFDRGDVTKRW